MSVSARILFWLKASRFEFLTGSFAPVLVGGAVAWWQTGVFRWGLGLLTLLGVMLIHAGANLANDYFDHLTGDDEANETPLRPFTGGSRVIQQGLATPGQVLLAALLCLAAGSGIGLVLAWVCGWPILVLGAIGVFTSFFYTAPPFALVYRGIGELFIALDFGVLPVLGAYFVQARQFSAAALWASLPVALLITAILFINEFPDYVADRSVNKRHWVVRLGRRRAALAYAAGMAAVYLVVIAAVTVGALPPLVLLVGLSLPIMARGVNTALAEYDDPLRILPANVATVMTHLGVSVLLSVGLILDRVWG